MSTNMNAKPEIPDGVVDEVADAYRASVAVPSNSPERQYLLCTIGNVGAGKTTVMKPLAQKLGLVRISTDDIRKLFHDRGYGYQRTRETAHRVTRDFLARGYSVGIDANCVSEEAQEHIERAKREYDVQVVWIHVNPPESFILEKLAGLTPNWLGSAEDMIANYYRRKPEHEYLDFPFVYTFNTAQGDLDSQIASAAEAIQIHTGNK